MTTKTQVKICPVCGMEESEWTGNQGKGIRKEGQTYCCEGCAEGTGCICMDKS